MTRAELEKQIAEKQSVLCVGLDTDVEKIPEHLLAEEDPVFSFNKAIIDATHQYAVAYKPNLAFYEAEGLAGWQSLEKTMRYLQQNYPHIFTIADAKRGDIGNTSLRYAKAFFEQLNFHSVTVAPYMGEDSVAPFLQHKGKWAIVLGLTSNEGSMQFQFSALDKSRGENFDWLYQKVLQQCSNWGTTENLMFVVGATKADFLKKVRGVVPNHFLLVPGVGAQGGSLADVLQYGRAQKGVGLLVNSSRGILYKSQTKDFAQVAAAEAQSLQQQMKALLF
jgi:orotidine-5'-phosphate decarboxylase